MTHREELYAERDPMELDEAGNYYFKHVMAMTSEQLHSKSAIAGELAHRDMLIDKLTKELQAAKAQAVPHVNAAIQMPRGYMLNTLIKFQKWRIGEDEHTLNETGLTPRSITLAIDWAIEQLDKSKAQPQWIPVSERLPENEGTYFCLGHNGTPFVCLFRTTKYEGKIWLRSTGTRRIDGITHWMPLPVAPEQNK